MSDFIYYFAYGSNMSFERIKKRINSIKFVCTAKLEKHELRFHKSSKDRSGKCDAAHTGDSKDFVLGAIYSISRDQLNDLDKFEGCGNGYTRKTVSVNTLSDQSLEVETYIATNINSQLRPFDWYKEHVIRGAKSIGLPLEYISVISQIEADIDENTKRRANELSIYKENQ